MPCAPSCSWHWHYAQLSDVPPPREDGPTDRRAAQPFEAWHCCFCPSHSERDEADWLSAPGNQCVPGKRALLAVAFLICCQQLWHRTLPLGHLACVTIASTLTINVLASVTTSVTMN